MQINKLKSKALDSSVNNDQFTPSFFRITNSAELAALNNLLDGNPNIKVQDTIMHQLKELVKCRKPNVRMMQADIDTAIAAHLGTTDPYYYGVWVYYAWKDLIVHLLDKDEFIELRTNRNKYKITESEQNLLATKKIGIIGLSVGQSIALTIAMERTCGTLRLADFDTADLSNLNRLRAGISAIGLKKTVIAAREILELDPYLDVEIYSDGITNDNIDDFFLKNGKLDLLVEVCDGLDIKILSRYKARELNIPVVMDTNDKGMVDVERFDLEPNREILHGLANGLDPQSIKGLTNEEKVPFMLKMVGVDTLSTRMKASMMEVEQSISTWPQLASSVALGGAITTDVIRRIFLDQYHDSGRYYIDFETLVADAKSSNVDTNQELIPTNPYTPITQEIVKTILNDYFATANPAPYRPDAVDINKIIDAAIAAPSAGNNQPWKWAYKNGILFLFHDRYRSWSWGDYDGMGSFMSIGAALENVHLQASRLGLEDHITLFPIASEHRLAAAIRLSPSVSSADSITLQLADNLHKRFTNRQMGERKTAPEGFLSNMQRIAEEKGKVKAIYTEDPAKIHEFGKIIAVCDKVRMLYEQGHTEFYSEIRWNKDQAQEHNDGIELYTVDLTQSEIAGFSVAKDWKAVKLLSDWNKGDAFMKLSIKSLNLSSAVAFFVIPEFTHSNLIEAGRAVERAWIFANMCGVSVHPYLSSAFFFSRLVHGKGEEMPVHIVNELSAQRKRFIELFELDKLNAEGFSEVFVMKLAVTKDIGTRSLRKPKQEVFFEID